MPDHDIPRSDRSGGIHSGAADLAVFGAVPAAFAPMPVLAGTLTGADDGKMMIGAANAQTPVGDGHHDGASGVAYIAGDQQMLASAMSLASPVIAPAVSASAPLQTTADDAPHSAGIATFVPMPIGSGAVLPTAGPESHHLDTATATSEVPLATEVSPIVADPAATLATILTSVTALHDVVTALAGALPATGTVPLHLSQTIDSTIAHANGVVAGALADVHEIGQTAITEVAGAAAAVSDVALSLPHTALETLAGSDPVGGITTLVGMVSAADTFNLHDTTSAATDVLTPALGVLGSADLLADVAPADVLLGVHGGHDGLLGGLDLHHDGLFGHL